MPIYQLHVTKIVTPRLLGLAEYRGYRGRSNENDLCFYNRQYLFSTVEVTEFQLPWLIFACLYPTFGKVGYNFLPPAPLANPVLYPTLKSAAPPMDRMTLTFCSQSVTEPSQEVMFSSALVRLFVSRVILHKLLYCILLWIINADIKPQTWAIIRKKSCWNAELS